MQFRKPSEKGKKRLVRWLLLSAGQSDEPFPLLSQLHAPCNHNWSLTLLQDEVRDTEMAALKGKDF